MKIIKMTVRNKPKNKAWDEVIKVNPSDYQKINEATWLDVWNLIWVSYGEFVYYKLTVDTKG